MDYTEFSQRFDVLYNNITSNQAPGLNEYEKSVFLTEGQEAYIKEQFFALNNSEQSGFDTIRKRYTDFAGIIRTVNLEQKDLDKDSEYTKLDPRAITYYWPKDVMFVINEQVDLSNIILFKEQRLRQILPISYDEYTRLMSKPFKQPNKFQCWRLLTDYYSVEQTTVEDDQQNTEEIYQPVVELIMNNKDIAYAAGCTPIYTLRYIKIPSPIITTDLTEYDEDLRINNNSGPCNCELHESTHAEILQKAVLLAKLAWEGGVQQQIKR